MDDKKYPDDDSENTFGREDGGSERDESDESGRRPVKDFFFSNATLIAALGAVLIMIAVFVLSVFFGSTVFDKAAMIWACLFVLQFAFWYGVNRRVKNLVFTIISGVLTLAFAALYVLELTGIL